MTERTAAARTRIGLGIALTGIVLGVASFLWSAVARADGTCDIEWSGGGMPLLVVTRAGVPYKGKAYVTYDDAVRLRDVLIASGECVGPATLKRCDIRKVTRSKFAVTWGGRTLGVGVTYPSHQHASRQVGRLVAARFCTIRTPAVYQTTADAGTAPVQVLSASE